MSLGNFIMQIDFGIYFKMKRIIDILLSIFCLVIASPVMLAIAIAVRFSMGAPIFFRQVRPGRYGRPFKMIKFRTMDEKINKLGCLLSDVDRLNSLGKFLRSTSLDELPELWNVLKGEMSLVGPRPLLMEYLPLYSQEQSRRHNVRPGVTGWAQVNGRNALSWEQKFELDIWYVDHMSAWLDLKILWLTLIKVLKRDGISASGEATMSKFSGSAK